MHYVLVIYQISSNLYILQKKIASNIISHKPVLYLETIRSETLDFPARIEKVLRYITYMRIWPDLMSGQRTTDH